MAQKFMTKFTRIEGSRDILVTNIMFLSNEASRLQEIIFQGISLRVWEEDSEQWQL